MLLLLFIDNIITIAFTIITLMIMMISFFLTIITMAIVYLDCNLL